MRIGIVTPALPRSQHGNRVTANRWQRIHRELGHRVTIRQSYDGEDWDLLVALHARKSAASVARFQRQHPDRPLLVTLTGTDLYVDLAKGNQRAERSITSATRLITLQSEAAASLPKAFRKKVRVIYQSVTLPAGLDAAATTAVGQEPRRHFDVFVIGHLRPVKDPFRVAMAVRNLPATSQIRVQHYGLALSEAMQRRAQQESLRNERYEWHGEVSHSRLMRSLARRAALLVQTSKAEGGPHSISEALATGVPVLASDIPGSTGMLGKRYPGLLPVGDTRSLRELLLRAEDDSRFYEQLRKHCLQAATLIEPERERQAWRELLAEFA